MSKLTNVAAFLLLVAMSLMVGCLFSIMWKEDGLLVILGLLFWSFLLACAAFVGETVAEKLRKRKTHSTE